MRRRELRRVDVRISGRLSVRAQRGQVLLKPVLNLARDVPKHDAACWHVTLQVQHEIQRVLLPGALHGDISGQPPQYFQTRAHVLNNRVTPSRTYPSATPVESRIVTTPFMRRSSFFLSPLPCSFATCSVVAPQRTSCGQTRSCSRTQSARHNARATHRGLLRHTVKECLSAVQRRPGKHELREPAAHVQRPAVELLLDRRGNSTRGSKATTCTRGFLCAVQRIAAARQCETPTLLPSRDRPRERPIQCSASHDTRNTAASSASERRQCCTPAP